MKSPAQTMFDATFVIKQKAVTFCSAINVIEGHTQNALLWTEFQMGTGFVINVRIKLSLYQIIAIKRGFTFSLVASIYGVPI